MPLPSGTVASLSLASEDRFQNHQWMPETLDSTESYIYYVFSYTIYLW